MELENEVLIICTIMPKNPLRVSFWAQLFHSGLLGIQLAHDLALVHHEDPVGDGHDLIQLQRNQQHGLACVTLGNDLAVDIFDGAHVQATGGLDGDEQLGILVDLTGNDGLLLVAAGHGPGNGDGALTGTDVILLDEPLGIGADVLAAQEAELIGELRFEVALQDDVVLQGVIQHQTVLVTVFCRPIALCSSWD